jgi:hypothetical protein
MARISSYPRDLQVNDGDAWIGTEQSNRLTRNFTAAAVAEYLNIKGKISISGQMVFKFANAPTLNGEFTGPADGDLMTSFTTVNISGIDSSGQEVAAFMNYLVGNNILINEQNKISQFGHYKITSYTLQGDGTYDLALTNIGGNGNLVLNKHYDFAAFTISSGLEDKNFVFVQGVPSATWAIQHNLGKFPSATIVDTGDTSVLGGQIEYIDNNNLTITFGSAFAGKAFLN